MRKTKKGEQAIFSFFNFIFPSSFFIPLLSLPQSSSRLLYLPFVLSTVFSVPFCCHLHPLHPLFFPSFISSFILFFSFYLHFLLHHLLSLPPHPPLSPFFHLPSLLHYLPLSSPSRSIVFYDIFLPSSCYRSSIFHPLYSLFLLSIPSTLSSFPSTLSSFFHSPSLVQSLPSFIPHLPSLLYFPSSSFIPSFLHSLLHVPPPPPSFLLRRRPQV